MFASTMGTIGNIMLQIRSGRAFVLTIPFDEALLNSSTTIRRGGLCQ